MIFLQPSINFQETPFQLYDFPTTINKSFSNSHQAYVHLLENKQLFPILPFRYNNHYTPWICYLQFQRIIMYHLEIHPQLLFNLLRTRSLAFLDTLFVMKTNNSFLIIVLKCIGLVRGMIIITLPNRLAIIRAITFLFITASRGIEWYET